MKKTLAIAAMATATTMLAASFASAQQMPTVEQTYQDIEATLGVVPTHIKSYPDSAVAGAWAMTKGLVIDGDNALEPKVKSLINLAVAAQIPCGYCIWLETKMARAQGATDEEIAEAVAQAAYVRHWSTVLNGMQVDRRLRAASWHEPWRSSLAAARCCRSASSLRVGLPGWITGICCTPKPVTLIKNEKSS